MARAISITCRIQVLLLLSCCLASWAGYADYICLYNGINGLIRRPWTLITASFSELHYFMLPVQIVVFIYASSYFERTWGSREVFRFTCLIVIIPNFLTWIVTSLITSSPIATYGGAALDMGWLVALKQLIPEHNLVLLGGVAKFRIKHLPQLFLFASLIYGFSVSLTPGILVCLGFLVSWTYLRFFKVNSSLSILPVTSADMSNSGLETYTWRGDPSETFSFAHFFPDAVHKPLENLGEAIKRPLTAVGLLPRFSQSDVAAAGRQRSIPGSTGHNANGNNNASFWDSAAPARAEAERRRALALRALDNRLEQQQQRQKDQQHEPLQATEESMSPTDINKNTN